MTTIIELANSLADLKEDAVLSVVRERVGSGEKAPPIMEELARGIDIVTKRMESGEYALAELYMATEIFQESIKILQQRQAIPQAPLGRIVIGKVISHREDYSKDVIAPLLACAGFQVHDLGENISSDEFIQKAKEVNADIIGITGLEATSVETAKRTISSIRASGVGGKIMVGAGILCGAMICLSESMGREIGADAAWNTISEAVDGAKRLVKAS